jgi:ABC-type amino acid transport substrate-binding protein
MAFVELAWEELIPALKGDRIDVIMSGMSVTPVRQHRVRFVQPYLRVGQMAIIRRLMLDSRVVDMRTL